MKWASEPYQTGHQPSGDYGAPMHDLTQIVAEDVYAHPEWYGFDEFPDLARLIQDVRGRPDALVTIYRAVPRGVTTINPGDWVTPSRAYAELHGESWVSRRVDDAGNTITDDTYDIVSRTVAARELVWPADYPPEWGWFPDNHLAKVAYIDSGGDAVPGGYNGYFVSWDDDGTKQGYLDYQIVTDPRWDDGTVLIAMVEVFPEYRHQGVATALLQRLRQEFPDREIETGYLTDDGAGWWQKVAGGTWDMSGDVPVWVQPYDELLADALYSWKGDPTSIAIWCQNIRQDPYRVPDSGSGKQMKAWAEAILEELESAPPIPRKLYRGTTERQPDPSLPSGWSELRSVAQTFGTGPVWVLDAGTARGIRIADYISSGRDSEEREWIVMGGDPYLYDPPREL